MLGCRLEHYHYLLVPLCTYKNLGVGPFDAFLCIYYSGFHQRCHNPPIPASALELDTPWNCMYCHRGVKCPFLTESLDVLQNLLSDDEEASQEGDGREVITIESDHEVAEDLESKPASPRKRKVCLFSGVACYIRVIRKMF